METSADKGKSGSIRLLAGWVGFKLNQIIIPIVCTTNRQTPDINIIRVNAVTTFEVN